MKATETPPDLRLNRWVARAGGLGRRRAELWITAGEITVEGNVALNPAQRIPLNAQVAHNGTPLLLPKEEVYLLYHKPRGVECTFAAREGRDLASLLERWPGIRYGGRLDRESEGLLLLSTDGVWLNHFTHPSGGWIKRYEVTTTSMELPEDLTWHSTVDVAELGVISTGIWHRKRLDRGSSQQWEVQLKQGKKRQIRVLARHFGGKVLGLRRLSVGPFELGDLGPDSFTQLDRRQAYKPLSEGSNSETGRRESLR